MLTMVVPCEVSVGYNHDRGFGSRGLGWVAGRGGGRFVSGFILNHAGWGWGLARHPGPYPVLRWPLRSAPVFPTANLISRINKENGVNQIPNQTNENEGYRPRIRPDVSAIFLLLSLLFLTFDLSKPDHPKTIS